MARCLELLENYRENFEEEDVPKPGDAPAKSSQESETAAPKKVGVGKHSIYTHVTKDQNCEMSARTEITRVLATQRTCKAIP